MNAAVMPAFRETLTEDEIRITPEAQTQLSKLFEQVEDEDIEAIRIYVTGGGCSGMTYGMTFTDQQTPYDRVMEYADFRLFIDAVALNYLHGVEIDYISRPTGASFVFNNVFASTGGSGTCGACGAGGGCG